MRESSTNALSPVEAQRLRADSPLRHLTGRNRTKADIFVYVWNDRQIAVKDYRPRPFLVRNTLGRLLIRRESAAYRAAAGLPGLPPFFGRLDAFALAVLWIDATRLAEMRGDSPDDAFFDRVDGLVRDLHGRGVALGDLHHRDVLVGRDGSPFVVDLATALVLGGHPGALRRALFRRLRDADLVALARMRARWTGRDVAAAVAAVGEPAAAWHRRGRRLKSLWDRLRRRA